VCICFVWLLFLPSLSVRVCLCVSANAIRVYVGAPCSLCIYVLQAPSCLPCCLKKKKTEYLRCVGVCGAAFLYFYFSPTGLLLQLKPFAWRKGRCWRGVKMRLREGCMGVRVRLQWMVRCCAAVTVGDRKITATKEKRGLKNKRACMQRRTGEQEIRQIQTTAREQSTPSTRGAAMKPRGWWVADSGCMCTPTHP
jgi:hypothetical protein